MLPADVTSGEFTMLDQTMPYGTGPPPHVDERYDEGFYILEAPSVARWTPITGS